MIIKIQNVFTLKWQHMDWENKGKYKKIGDACHTHGLEESILAA